MHNYTNSAGEIRSGVKKMLTRRPYETITSLEYVSVEVVTGGV